MENTRITELRKRIVTLIRNRKPEIKLIMQDIKEILKENPSENKEE